MGSLEFRFQDTDTLELIYVQSSPDEDLAPGSEDERYCYQDFLKQCNVNIENYLSSSPDNYGPELGLHHYCASVEDKKKRMIIAPIVRKWYLTVDVTPTGPVVLGKRKTVDAFDGINGFEDGMVLEEDFSDAFGW